MQASAYSVVDLASVGSGIWSLFKRNSLHSDNSICAPPKSASTADSEYIRAISVKYRRCPSSYSVRSALARTGFEVKPLQRPKTALQTVPPVAQPRPPTARVQKEKTQLLEELMFFYGRSVHESFHFTRQSTSPERPRIQAAVPRLSLGATFITEKPQQFSPTPPTSRTSFGSPWSCQNEALRQMFRASEGRPRNRFFPRGTVFPKGAKT